MPNGKKEKYMKKSLKVLGIALAVAMMLACIFAISSSAASTVHYTDANGESKLQSNVTELANYTTAQTLSSGWYIISGTSRGVLTIDGDVHIILADGADATSAIIVTYGNSVTIYAQTQGSGKLTGRIVGTEAGGNGNITINGGTIVATGLSDTPGIGGADDAPVDKAGDIIINGGNITATTESNHACGIGYDEANNTVSIIINGGNIVAKGGTYGGNRSYSAAIGSQYGQLKGIIINGGTFDLYGDSVGIGAELTPITINGGNIKVKGNLGPAIGGNSEDSGAITITGGFIDASTIKATVIGASGSCSPAAPITISGGTIIANGASTESYFFGIGGTTYFHGNSPYDLIITGGSLFASRAGDAKYAISPEAIMKDAEGNTVTFTPAELTLTGAGNDTYLTKVFGSTHNVNDVRTVNDKVNFFLTDTSLPTKIYTNKGIYLPASEGSTTYTLHDVHTAESVYTPHEEDAELHNEYHPCCDETEVEGHLFAEGKYVCECGLHAIALVDGTYFVNFDNALREAQKDESSTITLLMNAEIVDDIHINGNITLDLNGFSLITSNKYMYSIYLRTGSLTLKDSSEGKTGSILPNSANADTIGIENGTLTIENGKYGKIAGTNGTIIVKDGTIADITLSAGTLNIQGGEFGKLNSHTHLQPSLAENLFFYDKEGNIVDGRVMTLENVVTKTGADFANAIATLDINNTTYTGLHKEPGLVLSIFDSVVAAEHYDISYTENLLPGEATVTVSAKGIYTGATTATLNIAKGYLQVMENPTATHEFGDIYSDKEITGGKVVIIGNEETVVSGKWTWTEGEPKATFVPDESYNGLFEELTESYDVNIIVTAASPALNISAPSISILPGVDTPISVVAKNPYDEELTDIPVDYKIFYLVGEEGEEVMVEGLVFNLPNTVRLGDKVYLRVENIAVDGKYSVATSNTLVFTVGAIDYSGEIADTKEELNTAIEELKAAIESGEASDEVVAQKLDDLQKRIAEAEDLLENLPTDNASKSEVADLKELLEQADTDMGTLIQSLNSSLNSTKEDLDATKEDLDATKEDLDATKGELNATKGELENTKEALEATKSDLEATKTDMANRIGAIENEPAPKNTTAVVAVVIAAVSVLGNLALAAYMFLIKRR